MKNISQKEAIEVLKDMKIDIPLPEAAVTQRKRNMALNMAISALNCSEISNSSDYISRQAAIDVEGLDEQIRCEMCRNPMRTDRGCDGNCQYDEKLYERIIQILDERIKPLPSVQPEVLAHGEGLPSAQPEIIRCKDCMHYNAGFECLIEGYGIERNKDWFCGDAERRTDG